jgi:uncharacterized protein
VAAKKPRKKFEPWGFKLKVRRGIAGLGLYAEENIPKGACVIEYVGRPISKEEEEASRSRYLFDLGGGKTIDGNVTWNPARYINHACAPNCEAELWRCRVFIMARRSIKAGEELSYDYGKEYFDWIMKPSGCRCQKCISKLPVSSKIAKAE